MITRKKYINAMRAILSVTLFVLVISVLDAKAYTPPIGIPDPGLWGTTHPIDSTAPEVAKKCPAWPAAEASNCYYIDNKNVKATDDNNINGYPSKPRATIPTNVYTAGSYIEVHGGPYTTAKTLTINGTEEEPVWFRGSSPASMPDMRARIYIPNAKYVIFENLNFNNFSGQAISITGMSASHICVRNSIFRNMIYPGSSSSVIGSTPTQGGSIHDLVFYNNLFEDIGDWQAVADDDYHGINPNLWGRKPPTMQYNVWVLNNTGYHISGNLAQFNGDQRDIPLSINEGRAETNLQNFHHMYSGFNHHHHSRQDLSVMKLVTDGIISQNLIHDNYSSSSDAGTGTVFQEGPNYVWIIFNTMYNMDFGVRQSNMLYESYRDNKTFMVGNVIYNMKKNTKQYGRNNRYKPAQGIAFEKGNHKRYIIDNTIFNVGGGISISTATDTDSAIMSGNVIAGVNGIDDLGLADFHVTKIDAVGNVSVDYNFFEPRSDTGKVTFYWGGLSPLIKESLSVFQSEAGQCKNCWTGNPLFVDSSRANFRPQKNSPLIGKGIRHAVYDEFQARYGIDIAYDLERKPRPATGAWTLGAYEGTTGMPVIKKVGAQ